MSEIFTDTISGLQLLHWIIGQSDIWNLANKCADFVHKIHEPLERGAAVLDNILTFDGSDDDDSDINEWLYDDNWIEVDNMNDDEVNDIRTAGNRNGEFKFALC